MIHINRFIDRIKMLESKQARDCTMSLRDAKDLHSDITKLLLVLQELQQQNKESAIVHKIQVDGGTW